MSFSESSYGVMEDDGTVTLVISLSQTSSVSFEVTVNTMDVTAMSKYIARIISSTEQRLLISKFTFLNINNETLKEKACVIFVNF